MPYSSRNVTNKSGGTQKMDDMVKYAAKHANFVILNLDAFIKTSVSPRFGDLRSLYNIFIPQVNYFANIS